MAYIQLFSILPAALILWFTSRIRESAPEGQGTHRRFKFLLITLAVLLIILLITYPGLNRAAAFTWQLLMPVGCGVLAITMFQTISDDTIWSKNKLKSLIVLLTGIALIILMGPFLGDRLTTLLFALVGIFVALVWWVWEKFGEKYLLFGVFQIPLVGISLWAADTDYRLVKSPEWLSGLLHTLLFFLPAISIAIAARVIFDLFNKNGDHKISRALFGAFLALFTVFMLGYQMYLTSIWDVATDGLSAPLLLILVGMASIASAMLMAWLLPERHRLVALGFALLATLSMQYPNWIGTYGPNGKWGMSPAHITERRAEKIDNAVQGFYGTKGEYPASLKDLFPGYLVYIPRPIMIPGQTWCYEGGQDYFRFGYVYRQYFSSPASVRIHAFAGEPPNPDWPCEDEAAKYPGFFGYQSP